MEDDNTKYERILNILRNSKPVPEDPEVVSEKIIRRLREEKSKVTLAELLIEFLFGWVYVGWARRSMIAVSMVIVLLFGFQQVIILKRIKDLSSQRIVAGAPFMTGLEDELPGKMLIYKISGRKLYDEKLPVTKEEVDEMIKSLNILQVRYKDIIEHIQHDPELKKYYERRMNEILKKEP
jgi:hypothetical protein